MLFRRKAPEIIGIDSEGWINSEPLTLEKFRGKLVLLDFWTYSCVNCLRTLPALKEMWSKYKGELVIIGVHTPEFEFEKDLTNVKGAVKKHGIEYPVANDPERVNWERYGNRYWPRAALINAKGELIMDHIGESGYDEIEERIIEELGEDSYERMKEKKRSYFPGISRETYAGSLRNPGLGSGRVCTREGCEEYVDPGNHMGGVIYLAGDWRQESEYLRFKGQNGHISYRYYATEVNVVISGEGLAEVLLNDKPLDSDSSGADVVLANGKSYVKIEGADMYQIIKQEKVDEGELKIVPFKGLEVYAYTFG